MKLVLFFFFSSRRRHTRLQGDWSSDVCSSDLHRLAVERMRYNEAVQAYNTSRRQFPANITASIFGFKGDYPLFTAPESAKGRSEERRVGKEWRARCGASY